MLNTSQSMKEAIDLCRYNMELQKLRESLADTFLDSFSSLAESLSGKLQDPIGLKPYFNQFVEIVLTFHQVTLPLRLKHHDFDIAVVVQAL